VTHTQFSKFFFEPTSVEKAQFAQEEKLNLGVCFQQRITITSLKLKKQQHQQQKDEI